MRIKAMILFSFGRLDFGWVVREQNEYVFYVALRKRDDFSFIAALLTALGYA